MKGAEKHVERVRGEIQKGKNTVEKGGFKFTFKLVEKETTRQAEEMSKSKEREKSEETNELK